MVVVPEHVKSFDDVIRFSRAMVATLWVNNKVVTPDSYSHLFTHGAISSKPYLSKLFRHDFQSHDAANSKAIKQNFVEALDVESACQLLSSQTAQCLEVLVKYGEDERTVMEGSNTELEEDDEMPNEILWQHQVHRVIRFASELIANVTIKQARRRRCSFCFIRSCSILKHHSFTAHRYLRLAPSKALPHPNTLRSYAGNDDINVGIDFNHFLSIGSWSDSLEAKDHPCIIRCDLGYGDKKIEYSNGDIV